MSNKMLRWKKRMIACMIAVCLLCGMATNAFADSGATGTTETYSLATLTSEDGSIQVPVIQQTIQSRSSNAPVTSNVYVLVPDMTEESLERNSEYVEQIKTTGSLVTPRDSGTATFADSGFITFTSSLVYNTSYYQNYYRLYDIMSFRLNREIHTMAPYNSIHNATVQVNQVGSIGAPGDLELLTGQSQSLGEIQYGRTYSKGNDWSGNWLAVGKVDGYAEIGIVYYVRLDYADGTSRTLSYTHTVG